MPPFPSRFAEPSQAVPNWGELRSAPTARGCQGALGPAQEHDQRDHGHPIAAVVGAVQGPVALIPTSLLAPTLVFPSHSHPPCHIPRSIAVLNGPHFWPAACRSALLEGCPLFQAAKILHPPTWNPCEGSSSDALLPRSKKLFKTNPNGPEP
eukprot:EG_transcript_29177